MSPTRLDEAESNPLFFGASWATFNAPGTAAALGRDPDMRRNAPTTRLLAQRPKVREGTLGRRRAACRKKKMCILYIHIISLEIYLVCRYCRLYPPTIEYRSSEDDNRGYLREGPKRLPGSNLISRRSSPGSRINKKQ